jgi:RNA polymerase sigma factor (sigma-70 family)
VREIRSDAALLAAAGGSPELFAAVFDRHYETIHRYLERRAGRDAAEDLSGEVFRIGFEQRSRFRPVHESALPWLYGLATNLLLKHWRSESRQLRALARVEAGWREDAHDAAATHNRVDAQAVSARLLAAVARLSQGDRDVLLLFAWEELTYDEVAVALGIPEGTVRSRLNRARRSLRAVLGDLDQAKTSFSAAIRKDTG